MNRTDQITKRPSPFGREQRRDLPAVRVIPYDYVAVFPLTGEVGTLVQDVINISVEGVFVAVSIGYGLDEERAAPLTLRGPATVTIESPPSLGEMTREITLGEITLDNIPPDLLIEGFRINPQFAGLALKNGQLNEDLPFSVVEGPTLADPEKQGIFQQLKRTE